MTDPRPGFDDVDLTAMTVVHLAEYMAQLKSMFDREGNIYMARAIKLRSCEVAERIGEVEREIAVRNVRETERQTKARRKT